MIKLHAHIQKKVPLPGHDFSSQAFSAGLEVEVADNDNPAVIQERIRQLYALLNSAEEEQLAQAQAPANDLPPATSGQPRAPRIPTPSNGPNGHGNGQRGNRGGRTVMATAAQKKAIAAICKDQGLEVAEVLLDWDGDPEKLTVKEASNVIDLLKGKPAGNGNRR